MTNKFVTILFFFLAVTIGFTATAFAASASPIDEQALSELARPIYDAIMAGKYVAAGAFALTLAAALFRRYAPGKAGQFAQSDAGGTLLVFAMSFGGALGTAALAAASPTWSLAGSAFWVAVAAIGGYTALKKLAVDPLMRSAWYQDKAPTWLKAVLNVVVLWVFSKRDGAKATEKAEKAGADAVVANPPTGADGVIGKPSEL